MRPKIHQPTFTYFAAALLAVLMAVTTAVHADLRIEVERALRTNTLGSATVGISIRDSDTNVELVGIAADRPMIPASNMKLLTTGVALHLLGEDFAFQTKLLRDDDRLIILGDGDPAFGDPDLLAIMQVGDTEGVDVETFLRLWTRAVKEAGVTSVREVIVDDRIFDREFVHPTWPVEQLNRRYCAEVAGFNFHLNTLHFFPKPTRGSRPNISEFTPHARWLDVANSGTNRTGEGDSNTAWLARAPGSNDLRFHGNVKFAYRVPVPVTLHDMPTFFARLFSDRLESAGITVREHRVSDSTDPRSTGEVVGPIISTGIGTVITRANRDSNNLYAEALLKRCGAEISKQPGSWMNGSAVARHAIHERLGNPGLVEGVVIADGSGLSRDNRVSPQTLSAWLNTFHRDSTLGPIFLESLAEPLTPGTLSKRFRNTNLHGTRVQAKSGYINGVSTLSGFVTSADGTRRSFSIMVNDIPGSGTLQRARQLQEQIVSLIAADIAVAPAQLGSD